MERYIRCQVQDIEALDMGSRLLDGNYAEIEDRSIKTQRQLFIEEFIEAISYNQEGTPDPATINGEA
jgi:hypothetical protein